MRELQNMRMVVACMAFAALVSAAQAANRKIDDFYGRWIGTGQATQGAVVTQSRDSEVIIERAADGFKITWTTMSSSVGDASKSKVKAAELTFKKARTGGVFNDAKAGASDGKKTTWARVAGDTLIINQLVIAEDGQWDVTIYERTLKGADQMAMTFTRITNGAVTRQASLEMTRAKD